jgi:erythromycin esterase
MSTEVSRWVEEHARAVGTDDARGPLTDLAPLAHAARDATVVALGTATRVGREPSVLAHRMVRLLVEELGFRSVALEGGDAARVGLDRYVATGAGDPAALPAGARSFWQTAEIRELVRWMRDFNVRHSGDPVRFAGTAPHLRREMDGSAGPARLERALAENTVWWQEMTGDRIAYWGGLVHTLAGGPRTVSPGGAGSPPEEAHRSAGGHLRARYGARYVSVGLTFGRFPAAGVPAPGADTAEALLSSAGPAAYLLDPHADDAPPPARAWLRSARGIRLMGPGNAVFHVTGGSLADRFDLVAHLREVTPARPLPAPAGTSGG